MQVHSCVSPCRSPRLRLSPATCGLLIYQVPEGASLSGDIRIVPGVSTLPSLLGIANFARLNVGTTTPTKHALPRDFASLQANSEPPCRWNVELNLFSIFSNGYLHRILASAPFRCHQIILPVVGNVSSPPTTR